MLELLCDKRDQNLCFLRFLASNFDCMDNGFTNLLTSVRNSRSTLSRGVNPFLNAFRAFLDNEKDPEYVSMPLLTECFLEFQ